MTFQLDTSGGVQQFNAANIETHKVFWGNLSPFYQGYIEALIADSIDDLCPDPMHPFSNLLGFSDIAPATLARIMADCERHPNNKGTDPDVQWRRGRNAWDDRNPYGATYGSRVSGYWYPPLTPYLGDDGLIYLKEPDQ